MSPNTLIDLWKNKLGISDWKIITTKIDPSSIIYNGEKYFIGIHRDFGRKLGIIYHDIDLDEESIVHELLHIVFPAPQEDETFQDYERWITEAAENLAQSEDVWKPVCNIPKIFTGFQPYHHLEALDKNEK
jgi:hypothetical protein